MQLRTQHEIALRRVLVYIAARGKRAQQPMRGADVESDGARDLGGTDRAPGVGKVLEDIEHFDDALDASRARR